MALACVLTSAGAGITGAFFLWALEEVTGWHRAQGWLLGALPALGVAGAWLYRVANPAAAHGTALLVEGSSAPGRPVPFVMAPLILVTTLLTHLGGGSAGREGTALQLGGGIAAGVMRWLRLPPGAAGWLLPAGMASGFAAVFGTPWAAGLFAWEVTRGRGMAMEAARPGVAAACMACAWAGHGVAMACGAEHVGLDGGLARGLPSWGGLGASAACGLAMGMVARVFVRGVGWARASFGRLPSWWMAPALGGLCVGGAAWATGERGYLGLGMVPMDAGDPSIAGCFRGETVEWWAWASKLGFTVVTLGSGFRGGEVTPLFFVGATAGHALGTALGTSPALVAAAGMTSLFASASRAPWACAVMGWELFGWGALPCVVVACAAGFGSGPCAGLYPVAPGKGQAGCGEGDEGAGS